MNEARPFDLSLIEAADTAILTVMDISGDAPLIVNGQAVTIELYGPGSDQSVQADDEIARLSNNAMMMSMMQGKKPKADAAAEQKAASVKKLIACTKAIHGLPLDAKALYTNPRLGYITAQVREFQGRWANFLPTAATS
jgi:hypothetical protein